MALKVVFWGVGGYPILTCDKMILTGFGLCLVSKRESINLLSYVEVDGISKIELLPNV